MDDPRALAVDGGLRSTERTRLKKIEGLLAFEDPALAQLFSADVVDRARQAFGLLVDLVVTPLDRKLHVPLQSTFGLSECPEFGQTGKYLALQNVLKCPELDSNQRPIP
ncbi:MAG: hypothetical protein JJE35_12980 [Thermoleophilia bacterium]|nr:hypothetical protein [Thermoleophilia bacterium]